jgi:hypothetical protein
VVLSTQFTLLTECCLPDVEKYVDLFSSVHTGPIFGYSRYYILHQRSVRVAQSLVLCVLFCRPMLVSFFLSMVFSILQFTASDCYFLSLTFLSMHCN